MFQIILILILILVLLVLLGLLHGYTSITSHFGPRKSPTTGVQSYHYGLDIGAPTGCNIIAIFSGQVTYTGFNGANGFTVIVNNGNLSASYSHVSPTFIVFKGQYVNQGEIIATVGPKNVYGVPNNPYKDSNGNPTNRFYYWSSFTFMHKERRQSRQSFGLFLSKFFCKERAIKIAPTIALQTFTKHKTRNLIYFLYIHYTFFLIFLFFLLIQSINQMLIYNFLLLLPFLFL